MLKVNAEIETTKDGLTVWAIWSGEKLDRPKTYGISLGFNATLAKRVAKAMNAQKLFISPQVVKDVEGNLYVRATCAVTGRHLDRDLKQLGF